MPPQFLYFDLGNVLVTFSNERMLRQMAQVAGLEAAAVQQLLMPTGGEGDLQWRFEAGEFSPDEYYEQFCQLTATRPPRAALELAASDMFAPIEASLALSARLNSAGHRLGLLSNTNAWHWRFLLGDDDQSGLLPELRDTFEIEVTSFNAQSMKPAPAIYEQAIERAGVEACKIFFTDDRPENVAGAKEMGIDAVQFVSTEQLIEELQQRGIDC